MAYSFQTFSVGQVLTAAQVNQIEVNVRDHQHGVSSVFDQAATQADLETGSSVILYTTPGRQHYHQSAAKGWCIAGVTGNLLGSYNVASFTDVGVGNGTVVWDVDFSGVTYSAVAGYIADFQLVASLRNTTNGGYTASQSAIIVSNLAAVGTDPIYYSVIAFGDQ